MTGPSSIAVLYDDEVRLVLQAIDDLACLALGVFPPGTNVETMLSRSREADQFADRLAGRAADRDAAREHHQAVLWRRDWISSLTAGPLGAGP